MKKKILIIAGIVLLMIIIIVIPFTQKKNMRSKLLNELKISEEQIKIINEEIGIDDFQMIYEIEFNYNQKKYEYEQNVFTKKIKSYSQEVLNKVYKKSSKKLLQQDIEKIVLDDTKFKREDIDYINVKSEGINDYIEYEAEFIYKGYKYEYVITSDKKIIKKEKEKI